jgi:hypothetical protein
MPKKASKLALLADQIAVARRIIEGQQTLLEKLRIKGEPTREAEGALRTYVSSLMHLLAHEDKIKNEAKAKKGETRKKKAKSKPRHRSPSRRLAFRQPE